MEVIFDPFFRNRKLIFSPCRQRVNFINILRAAFSYESVKRSFSVLTVCVCILFWQKETDKKAVCKILMNHHVTYEKSINSFFFLSPGINHVKKTVDIETQNLLSDVNKLLLSFINLSFIPCHVT